MSREPRRLRLLLLELVFSLALFVLCAAVCTALLVYARGMSRESETLTQAVYLAQSAVERWRATGETPAGAAPGAEGLVGRYILENGALTVSVYQGERLVYTLEGVAAP